MGLLKKIITGIGDIAAPVSTSINAFMQSRENRKNREWTEQQNELAWQRQNQLINVQRAYDTPKAQMARLMDAGLNPNLIYGDLGGNMQAHSAPNAAGSYSGIAPQIDPLAMSQSLLNLANARKADKETDLTAAQVKRAYKIMDAEYEKITADANYVKQMINSNRYREQVELFKSDLFNDTGFGESDENGYLRNFSLELRSLIANTEVDRLRADDSQYKKALELFLTEIGFAKAQKHNIELQNKDLEEFVKVCARIYESDAAQADYIKSIAELNEKFYGSLGASNDVIRLIFGFLNMFIGGVNSFRPRK